MPLLTVYEMATLKNEENFVNFGDSFVAEFLSSHTEYISDIHERVFPSGKSWPDEITVEMTTLKDERDENR